MVNYLYKSLYHQSRDKTLSHFINGFRKYLFCSFFLFHLKRFIVSGFAISEAASSDTFP